MVQHHSIKDQVRTFVVENFIFDEGDCPLGDDDSFLDNRIIDSTGVLELMMFLEETYGIDVADAEVVPDNLDSVARTAAYVSRKLAALATEIQAAA